MKCLNDDLIQRFINDFHDSVDEILHKTFVYIMDLEDTNDFYRTPLFNQYEHIEECIETEWR